MAAGAEPRRFHVAVACQYHAPGAAHRERIGRIVEGGEAVGAVLPIGVGVGVAARAVVVPHQVLRLDESAARGSRQRGQEIDRLGHRLLSRLGKPHSDQADAKRQRADAKPGGPANGASCQAMQDEQPARQERRNDVQPIRNGACRRMPQFHHRQAPRQGNAGGQKHDDGGKERQPKPHGQAIGAMQGATHVHDAVHQRWHQNEQPERQVGEEHRLIEGVLQADAAEPLPPADGTQIGGVHHQQREQRQHCQQQLAHSGPDDRARATRLVFHLLALNSTRCLRLLSVP